MSKKESIEKLEEELDAMPEAADAGADGAEEEEGEHKNPFRLPWGDPDPFEWWARIGIGFFVVQASTWIVVYLRLGMPSVYAHDVVVPVVSTLSLAIILWGLIRMLFNPPLVRRSRVIGMCALFLVRFAGNDPWMVPPTSTEHWKSSHTYRLPFNGTWYTEAGGTDKDRNYHATTIHSRWAYDFTAEKDGKEFKGQGTRDKKGKPVVRGKTMADYYCFGAPILAPVAGTVVLTDNTVPDNKPGKLNADTLVAKPLGNYVAIKAGPKEFLYLSQLKKGSITVKPGDHVHPGEKVGECGNSGRSLTPRVIVHLQNSDKYPFTEGMPLRFSHYTADGKYVARGMPMGQTPDHKTKGQIVENRPVNKPKAVPTMPAHSP